MFFSNKECENVNDSYQGYKGLSLTKAQLLVQIYLIVLIKLNL